MLRVFLTLMICLSAVVGCNKSWKRDSANQAVEKQSQRFETKHGLELKALRRKESPDGRIQRVHVGYFSKNLVSIDEARETVVDVVEQLLQRLNEDERTRDRLSPYPFTGDQIDLVVKIDHFFGDFFDATYVGRIVLTQGLIYYYTFDGKLTAREVYTEAREAVRDKNLEDVRFADVQNSEYKEQWLTEMRGSTRLEQLREELKQEAYTVDDEPLEEGFPESAKRRVVETPTVTVKPTQHRHPSHVEPLETKVSQPVENKLVETPTVTVKPTQHRHPRHVSTRTSQESESELVDQPESLQQSMQHALGQELEGSYQVITVEPVASDPRGQDRISHARELPRHVGQDHLETTASLEAPSYRSYEDDRDQARPSPQVTEALIDSLILELIDEEVRGLTSAAVGPEVEEIDGPDIAQSIEDNSDEVLLELAESLSVQSEQSTAEASVEEPRMPEPVVVEEPSREPDVVIMEAERVALETEEPEPFVMIDEALEEEEEELVWGSSPELEVIEAQEAALEDQAEELEDSIFDGPAQSSAPDVREEPELIAPLERSTQSAPLADALPPVELELEALLDLQHDFTEDWLDIGLYADDDLLEEVEVQPVDDDLTALQRAIMSSRPRSSTPGMEEEPLDQLVSEAASLEEPESYEAAPLEEVESYEAWLNVEHSDSASVEPVEEDSISEVVEEAVSIELSSAPVDFETAAPLLWPRHSSGDGVLLDEDDADEFIAAPPKGPGSLADIEQQVGLHVCDKLNAG